MRAYQTEIAIADDETRSIEVPLEREVVAVYAPPPKPKIWWPGGEVALALGGGEKMNAGGAGFFDARVEIGWKPGAPTELALVVDLGSINPGSNNCGTLFHGPNRHREHGDRTVQRDWLAVERERDVEGRVVRRGRRSNYRRSSRSKAIACTDRDGSSSTTRSSTASIPRTSSASRRPRFRDRRGVARRRRAFDHGDPDGCAAICVARLLAAIPMATGIASAI